jgi:putative transferase (TIGR04331 family)
MKKLFLVTTALEDTWPESDKSILFLGEWCRLYSRKQHWKKFDSKIVPYHWDDRDKLYKDYQYLHELFERLLIELTTELNKIHGVSYSLRYWRIIIGPWLMMFLSSIYDRWECLQEAIHSYSIEGTKVYDEQDIKYVPQDMEHYTVLSKSDEWNHMIYSSILKFISFDDLVRMKRAKNIVCKTLSNPLIKKTFFSKLKHKLKTKLRDILAASTLYFSHDNNYFFIATYLNVLDIIKLQLKLNQVPVLYHSGDCTDTAFNDDYRKWQLTGSKSKNKFEQFAKKNIPLQIPINYLEGYSKLTEQINKCRWPKRPKLIWTSNAYFLNDVFKLWSAEKVEEGIPLVIGQHGGHYGQGLFNFTESLELSICDYYLSWGWKKKERNVIPVGSVKKSLEKKRRKYSHDSILFLISGTPRYSDCIISMPTSSQWVNYMDDQIEFYDHLPDYISNDVVVRLYPHDFGWSQRERWKDKFPLSNIDEGNVRYNKQLLTTKLVISGWNSTTYLESMLSNIPTIIFWGAKYFELNDDAKASFDELKKVGVFHDTPLSAANHIITIWDEIDLWWERPDVVSAKNNFINKYAASNDNLDRLSSTFRSISDKGQSNK